MRKSIFILLCYMLTFAGNPTKVGTSSGILMLLNADARGLALSGTHYASVNGINSIFYNPAGLQSISNMSATFSSMNYYMDLQLSQFAYGLKLGENTAIAVQAKFLDLGEFEVTTLDAPNGSGEVINPSHSIYGITYSQRFTKSVSFGASFNYYTENFDKATGSAMGLNLGIQYAASNGLHFGIALQNIGTDVTYTQRAVKVKGLSTDNSQYYLALQGFALPTQFHMSLNYNYEFDEENALLILSNFTNFNQGLDRTSFGAEYSFQKMFFLRGSYQSLEESDSSLNSNLALGFGVKLNLSETSNVELDYSYRNVEYEDFGASSTIGIILNF